MPIEGYPRKAVVAAPNGLTPALKAKSHTRRERQRTLAEIADHPPAAVEQSATLAKSLKDREAALQRAEQKIATLEAGVEEQKRATIGELALFEEKIARFTEQLEAESAARLFAEGALQTAREERGVRRQDGDIGASPNEALSARDAESAQSNILRLRR